MTPSQRRRAEVAVRVLDQLRDAYILHGPYFPAAVSRWTIAEERRPALDALLPAIEATSARSGSDWMAVAGTVRARITEALDAADARRPVALDAALGGVSPAAQPIASAALRYILTEPA